MAQLNAQSGEFFLELFPLVNDTFVYIADYPVFKVIPLRLVKGHL